MVAARSPARTRRRSIGLPPTRPAGWPSTSSLRARPAAASSKWRTPSAWLGRRLVLIDTFGTEEVDPAKISEAIAELFDLRPAAIIRDLELRRPIYRRTAAYGHFGRSDKELSWEHTPRLEDLRSALSL